MNSVSLPLVSVIITNYNYTKYIVAAINSVRDQTYQNFNCIIVDDCSSDGSSESIVTHLQQIKDQRFKFFKTEKNGGQMNAIMVGFENTSGEFVLSVDGDDLLMPSFLDIHVKAHLNNYHPVSYTASETILINETGNIITGTWPYFRKKRPSKFLIKSGEIDSDLGKKAGDSEYAVKHVPEGDTGYIWSGTSSIMFRRAVLKLVLNNRCRELRICADYYLALFSQKIGGSLLIEQPLSAYRLHGSNNFAKNSIVGGLYHARQFSAEHNQVMEITRLRLIEGVNDFLKILGPEKTKSLIKLTFKKNQIYEVIKNSPELIQAFGGRRPYLKYKIINLFKSFR
jgi:glycosyltransferase involved in cell wall biosynthesis